MLGIDLKGKVAFVAGIGDDQGYGWAIAKALAEAGATILAGTWPPVLKLFTQALAAGKFDASRQLGNGEKLEFAKVYPLDAAYDRPEDVPQEVLENKRYKELSGYTISEVAALVAKDFGKIDMVVHSLANAPEISNSLVETSRKGYLTAMSTSAYSFVSLLHHFGPHLKEWGAALSLSYLAAQRTIPGYGGGMSSAKAALESDTRTLAWEAGRRWNVRVNAISAGPLRSRAARAIGFIDKMIDYSCANAPLDGEMAAMEVAYAAAFLLSPLAKGITGTLLYVDHGLSSMGLAIDSAALQDPVAAAEVL